MSGRGGKTGSRGGRGGSRGRGSKSKSSSTRRNSATSGSASNSFDTLQETSVTCAGPCKQIFEDDSDQMLSCDRCNSWTCRECANVPENLYEFLTNRDDFPYFCEDCKLLAMTAVHTDADIEEKCKKYCSGVENRLQSIEENMASKAEKSVVDNLAARVISIEQKINSVAQDISKVNSNISLVRSEPEEKARRVKNVIIRGLPETDTTVDSDLVKAILTNLDCDEAISHIDDIKRLGAKPSNTAQTANTGQTQPSDTGDGNQSQPSQTPQGASQTPQGAPQGTAHKPRPRPLRIIFKSEDTKKKVLKNATKIRGTQSELYNNKEIFIVPDQTKMERDQDLALRRQLKNERTKDPNGRYIIRRGKVIKL